MDDLNKITVTSIDLITTVLSPHGQILEMKNRSNYGLSFCTAGQITYVHKGISYISDESHAVLLPKGESYTLYRTKSGTFPLINFQCSDFFCDRFVVFPLHNPELFIKDYEHMKNLSIFENNRAKIMSLFYEMLSRLPQQVNPENSILIPALQYLEMHYYDPFLSNDVLAEQSGISEVYFRKLFTKTYGISPKQYILNLRIQKAKQLLTDAGFTVTAVSEKCGFASVYHFSRAFKAKTGLTPTEYLNQAQSYRL